MTTENLDMANVGFTQTNSMLQNPSFVSLIPTLNGKNYSLYFENLESMAKLSAWSEEQMLVITTVKLEGPARQFYSNTLRNKNLSYSQLKSEFREHFAPKESFAQTFSELTSATQGPTESCKDFASRIEGCVSKTNAPTDFQSKLKMSQFISGLRPSIRAHIQILNPLNFDDATETATRVELSQETLTSSINAVQQNFQTDHAQNMTKTINMLSQQIEKLQTQVATLSVQVPKDRNNFKATVTCHFCGIRGHIAPDCRKKKMHQSQQNFRQTGRNFRHGREQQHYVQNAHLNHQAPPFVPQQNQVNYGAGSSRQNVHNLN